VRACDVHNVACATNMASAHLVLSQLQADAAKSQPVAWFLAGAARAGNV